MRGQALMQLSQVGLQFNEARSDNPFAYYTQTITNSFTRILNLEKRNQTIRDDILIDSGHLPSYSRQMAHEEEIKKLRESAQQEHSDDIEAFDDAWVNYLRPQPASQTYTMAWSRTVAYT